MKIDVTRSDIDAGVKADPEQCAIALAATRAFGRPVSATYGNLWDGGQHSIDKLGRLPEEVRSWLYDFDYGRPVKPISFEMLSPEAAR